MAEKPAWVEELLRANAPFAAGFDLADVEAVAAKGVAVVTCMDTRIDPLRMLGLVPGDAKIMRNAGGRVTDDVLRSLVLATYLLGVRRVLVVHHTECALTGTTDDEISAAIGTDPPGGWGAVPDLSTALAGDVRRVRDHALLGDRITVVGLVYDVRTGGLSYEVPATGDPGPSRP